jgi:hypothetical protein
MALAERSPALASTTFMTRTSEAVGDNRDLLGCGRTPQSVRFGIVVVVLVNGP